jgi:peroxiredoxin
MALAVTAGAADPAPATPPPPKQSEVADQLQALVQKTKAKLQNGARTEAALADELKGFDALLAAHASEKTDDVAEVLLMKAALYLQVMGDFDKGGELMQQVKAQYPGTRAAHSAGEVLAQIAQEKESQKVRAALQPGAIFPDFQEKDLAGAPLSLANYKGKVVLVDFWATWCGPCVAELPNVRAAYQKYHAKGFEIVGISLDRSEAALRKFLKEKDIPWAQYFDGKGWDSKLGKRYGVASIPATYLLDREGRILDRDLRGEALDAKLAEVLGK